MARKCREEAETGPQRWLFFLFHRSAAVVVERERSTGESTTLCLSLSLSRAHALSALVLDSLLTEGTRSLALLAHCD